MSKILEEMLELQRLVENETEVTHEYNKYHDYIKTLQRRKDLLDKEAYVPLLVFYRDKSRECERKHHQESIEMKEV